MLLSRIEPLAAHCQSPTTVAIRVPHIGRQAIGHRGAPLLQWCPPCPTPFLARSGAIQAAQWQPGGSWGRCQYFFDRWWVVSDAEVPECQAGVGTRRTEEHGCMELRAGERAAIRRSSKHSHHTRRIVKPTALALCSPSVKAFGLGIILAV